jgi:hypothetical protein
MMDDTLIDMLIAVFVLNTLFAIWVVFRGGAEWLWRALAGSRRQQAWTPGRLRAMIASLWGVNAWALWVVLDVVV